MDKLIEALQIFVKYKNPDYPTHCEHDVLTVVSVPPDEMSEEDVKRLDNLSFTWDADQEAWTSYKFGSC